MVKQRDINLDIIRGIAAFSVVANHVLSHYEGFSESIVGNINFSLQNPLFMMVSGWALIYAKPINDLKSLSLFVKKRSVLLLLPWLIWSLIRFSVSRGESFTEFIFYNIYHMEGLYWFLFSLWVMNMIWAVASLVFNKLCENKTKYLILVVGSSLILSALLFVVAYLTVGISLLGTKFTVYYFPFFLGGWLFALAFKNEWTKNYLSSFGVIVMISFLAYIILVSKFDLGSLPDSWAPLRMVISFMGCLVVFQTVFSRKFNPNNSLNKVLAWGGQKTLELYVVHYITMSFLKTSETSVTTVLGFTEFIINLLIVLIVTCVIIEIINSNSISRKVLFGKNIFS